MPLCSILGYIKSKTNFVLSYKSQSTNTNENLFLPNSLSNVSSKQPLRILILSITPYF